MTLGEGVNVAYIDLHADNQDGYIRCTDAESAKTICEKSADGFKFNLVKGMLNDRYGISNECVNVLVGQGIGNECVNVLVGHEFKVHVLSILFIIIKQ